MSTETTSPKVSESSTPPPAAPSKPMRLWPAVVLIVAFWAVRALPQFVDMTISSQFFTSFIPALLLCLLFSIWWLTGRGIRVADRFIGFAVLVGGCWLAVRLSDPSIGLFTVLIYAVPIGFTLWTAWLVLGGKRSAIVRKWGAVLAMLPIWILFGLLRMDGLDGDLHADMHWRWTPSAEERLIAERARTAAEKKSNAPAVVPAASPLVFHPGDWTGLRGPDRNGEVHGLQLATDWEKSPPKEIWRAKIGPAWSSFVVIGDRLFTQEQRDKNEAVDCLDAATGHEIWVHEDKDRYWDSQGGAGPRGTPVFDGGRLYSLGATGILNCLDAATGDVKWMRKIADDAKTTVPMWGYSGSPLVVGDLVIVYAGGGEKGLAAYHAANGEPAWTAPTGTLGYSSPQLVSIGGENQVLSFDDSGVIAVDPATGALRWRHDAPSHGWRAVQPHALGDQQVLFGSEDLGLVLVGLKKAEQSWTATQRWTTKNLKPAYNDFVLLDGSIYGFDGGIFCCVDAKTGERHWKGGHYGHGQVLLLADQRLLLVLSETGEVVLLTANPRKLDELGKFQALEGKTWNNPAIAHGRLYVRNDQVMACYELAPVQSSVATR
jgi:outer membrane protein assembly factor BamB